MRTSLALIASLLLSWCALGQTTPYYDALILKGFVTPRGIIAPQTKEEKKLLDSILNYYGYKNGQNPFLDQFSTNGEGFSISEVGKNGGDQSKSLQLAKSISSIGSLDVTNLAEGMAIFMIDRAKEELTVSFFNRFKEFTQEHQEIKILFPKTSDCLENLLDVHYAQMLPALRTKFDEDLQNIPNNMAGLLDLPQYQPLLQEFPEIKITIQTLQIIHQMETGRLTPVDFIAKLGSLEAWDQDNQSRDFNNFRSTIKLGAIFSESLRYKDGTRNWIRPQMLDSLVRDTTCSKIFLGLLYQRLVTENITFKTYDNNTTSAAALLAEQKENIDLFQRELYRFIQLAENVDLNIQEIKEKKKKSVKITPDDYYSYINTSLDIIDYSFEVASLFNPEINISDYAYLARKSNNLYRYCYHKDYALAITTTTDIITKFKEITKHNESDSKSLLEKTIKKEDNNSYKDFISNVDKNSFHKNRALVSAIKADNSIKDSTKKALLKYIANSEFNKLVALNPKIITFGLFMAGMVAAETPEEVQLAIENAVLPAGSSSIKKKSEWNVAVQSYLGGFYQLKKASQENTSWNNEFGLHGPIGFSVSYGFKKWGAISGFLSVFDLGAIIDYKLTQDSVITSNGASSGTVVKKAGKITLEQIVSPGVYLVYGFPWNLPISLGVGTQYGPGLSKISQGGVNVVNNPSWRPCVFLSVDIPLVNLYNKPW
jgi:hypothetical protein